MGVRELSKKDLTPLLLIIALLWMPVSVLAEGPLKVALLPILDVLPFHVAESEGYFSEAGIQVEAIPVASGLERDQLMQSGAIDGMLTEMTTTATFNREKIQVRIVRTARTAHANYPLFRLLASPGSGLTSPAQLAGVPIGVSKNTIIEYVTDRLLTASGLRPEEIVTRSVPVIPERYQLLMQGQLKAATLPDPLAKSALESGALAVVDDASYPDYSVSVLSFTTGALSDRPDVVKGFLAAWDRASARINDNPEAFRDVLIQRIRVPKNIQSTYAIPPFPRNTVPSAAQWADVMDWMVQKGLLEAPLPYEDSITAAFLR
jgi:NitT/TauT family transport system substrate-binding protein